MSIRILLISLLLVVGSIFGDQSNQADYVIFSWSGGTGAYYTNGGGCTKAAWDAGSPSDFMNTSTGAARQTRLLTVTNLAGVVGFTDSGANSWFSTANFVDGTLVFVDSYTGNDLTDLWYIAERSGDDDTIKLLGSTYVDDVGDTATIRVGGAISGLSDLITYAPDLIDATNYNEYVYINGDETIAVDTTIATGGGTASTLLSLLGVDSSWVRVVPTRTTANGGTIANYLLNTSIMPTITLSANAEFLLNVPYVHVDGLYFTGDTGVQVVGTSSGDYQSYTNSVFKNITTSNGAMALRTDNYSYVNNCDIIAFGATGDTVAFRADLNVIVNNCRIINNSSLTSSKGMLIQFGVVTNSLFDSIQGIAINWTLSTSSLMQYVANNTFWECGTDVSYPNSAPAQFKIFVNNISSGNDTTVIDNLYTSDVLFFGYYNRIIGRSEERRVGKECRSRWSPYP